MIGRTVSHYRILAELGTGGMGVVYRAEDLSLGRHVALKFLPPHLSADATARHRFVHEAKAAANLDHSGICTVYDFGESDGQLFIAMALLEGQTLKDRLAQGPLPLAQALDVAVQVAEALQAAHDKGVVHRDIKPANIMLAPNGQAKVMDFGLAQQSGATQLTQAGSTLGTAAYMSPEQARGNVVDLRTDIWSLGAVLYEMIAGRRPFAGDYQAALAYAVQNVEPMPLTSVRSGVPLELERIVGKCLAKDPAQRYQHADELAADRRRLQIDSDSTRTLVNSSRLRRSRSSPIRAVLIAAAAIAAAAFFWRGVTSWLGRAEAIDSIAVLPLENMSNDPEQEYFVDGMTDELIGQLGKVHALKVISRTSSMQYKGTKKAIQEIAHDLNVDAVVEGSVRRDGDRVRISIDLVNARTNRSIWTDTYEMTVAGVFAVQTEVAAQVVGALRTRLSPAERDRLERAPPSNTKAYQLCLKGNYFLNKRLEDETRKAIQYFKQALDLDPGSAAAHEGLANAYESLSRYGYARPDETYPEARRHALRALELDESRVRAHEALATLSMFDWQWEAGEREFRRAVELDPSLASTRDRYAFFLLWLDRTAEAVAQEKRAVELDPLNIAFRQNLGEVLYYARRYDESIQASLETIDMDPIYPQAHLFLGMAYAAKGLTEEAVKALDRDREISGGMKAEIESLIGVGYAMAGQTDLAREIYRGKVEQSRSRFISAFPLACICFVLGDVDRGFEWLAEGFEQHDPRMSFIKVHPACDNVRADPRYLYWLKKMGLVT